MRRFPGVRLHHGPDGGAVRAAWAGLLVFLGLCLLGGGSNLSSSAPLVVLRPAAILLVAALLMLPARGGGASMRVPVLLMAAYTACVAIQLVPLPPGVWTRLPGHAALAGLIAAVGEGGVWRPISLVPSLTLGSLLATLTGWAIVLAFARLPGRHLRALAGVIVLMAVASCLVALLQLIGGSDSVFYFYKTDGSISGLLANRNHQAALLAATLPLLRVWMVEGTPEAQLGRGVTAGLLGALLLGALLLTGSRSGLVLALIGIVAAYAVAPPVRSAPASGGWRRARGLGKAGGIARLGLIALPVLLPMLLLAAAIATGRDLSIQRLFTADYAGEERLRNLPTTLSLIGAYFPFGSGYGSFDAVFRLHEPDALLKATYFNRAHDDFIELAITGGILPLLLLAVFAIWAAGLAVRAARRPWREEGVLHARAGAAIVLVLAVASVSDYPVRPPLMTAVGAIAVCWLARLRAQPGPGSRS